MNEFVLDHDSVPLYNNNLVEEYKANISLVMSESILRSLMIAPTKHPSIMMEPGDLLNIKVALLLDPARVMAVNDSRKLDRWQPKESLDKQRNIVINIKEKLDITLQTIRELVLDSNDNRFNVLPLEIKYSLLNALDPDLAQIPLELWLPKNVDLAHLEKRDKKIDQALQDKQINNTAVLSYHQFRRNNGCPDNITRLAIKDNQNLIKERLLAYMLQRKLPQQLNHHKRLLLVHEIGKEQSGISHLTAKIVDQSIEAVIKKITAHQTLLENIQEKQALSKEPVNQLQIPHEAVLTALNVHETEPGVVSQPGFAP